MAVKFGLFVPQGWKMDLVGIDDPAEQYEAMTAVARDADAGALQISRANVADTVQHSNVVSIVGLGTV